MVHDMLYGKTSPEPFLVTQVKTSASSSKSSAGSKTRPLRFLRLSGNQQGWSRETAGVLPGESSTPNIGESPSAVRESSLSQILEAEVPAKYFLSERACEGILRRAKARGEELPPMLKEALEQQALVSLG